MIILHTETLKRWGGQQNRVLTESLGLNRRGHRAIIACHRGSVLAQRATEAGLTVYELNMVKQAYPLTVPQLVSIIRKEKADIVSTHSSVDSWAGGIAAKLTGRKLVRFRHNLYEPGRDPLTRLIYAMPDAIITISDAVSDVLIRVGLRTGRLTVIPSAVDPSRFSPEAEDLRDELKIPRDAPVIGNTSTFTRVKGQQYLLQAFNSICREIPCFLLFAGRLDDPFQEKYLKHVDSEFRDRVILLGQRGDIPRVLKTLDVYVFPSFLEGLGTALIEAMSAGNAIALSDIPTFRSFIEDGRNGIFFNPEDADDLARKVLSLLRDPAQRKALGREARSTVLESFTVDRMIEKTETLYKKLLGESGQA